MTSYPTAIKSFTDQVDGSSTIDATDINQAYDEIEAIETAIGINTFSTETAGSVFNEGSNDMDFRFEGNGDANLLQLDAGNDRVGIGTASPTHKFHVAGTEKVTGQTVLGASGNVIEAVVTKTAITDNTATEVFTITTTNETGDFDGGVWTCFVDALSIHNGLNNGDNASMGGRYSFSRAQQATGTGQLTAVIESGETAAAESEGGTTKGIASVTCTLSETSEYVTSVRFTIDLDGSAVTTAVVVAHVKLIWYGYTTAPVIA